MEGQNIIIIKKVKKIAHSAPHGGSWKVAYADFVTAMMAFFLLLWLITMVAPEKRARVANYFKHFSMFDKSGDTFLDLEKTTVAGVMFGDDKLGSSPEPDRQGDRDNGNEVMTPEKQFQQELEKKIEQELGDTKDQVMVQAFEGGVRIELIDAAGSPMFTKGRSEITPEGKKVLKVIGENLITSGSKVALEGHTDAFTFPSKQQSNWELSTERASAARKELEHDGLPPERLLRVAGFADTEPLIKDDAFDPRNRRISIVVYGPRPSLVGVPKDSEVQVASASADQTTAAAPQSVQEDPIDPVHQYLFNRENPAKRKQNPVEVDPGQALLSAPEDPKVQVSANSTAQPTAEVPQSVQEDPIDPVHQYLFDYNDPTNTTNNTVLIGPRPALVSVPKGSEVQVSSNVTVQPTAAAPQNAQPTTAAPQSAQEDPIDPLHQFLLDH
jgi:chemotaxis protein MotB